MKQSIYLKRLTILNRSFVKFFLTLCLLLSSIAVFSQNTDATNAQNIVKKVYSTSTPAPTAVKANLSADFYNLYSKCYSENKFLPWVWGFCHEDVGRLTKCTVASSSPTQIVVNAAIVCDHGNSPIKVNLIKENGVWVIDDVLTIICDETESSKAQMKKHLSTPHDGMLLSEVAKLPGIKWIADAMPSASGMCFSIRVQQSTPDGDFEYQTTAEYATVYGEVDSTGLTQIGIKKILSILENSDGDDDGEGVVITVSPEYFNKDGKIVEESYD